MKCGRAGSLLLLLSFTTLSLYALEPPPWTGPEVTSLLPQMGSTRGGDIVTIGGSFYASDQVRVFFDWKEAFVASKSNNQIVVVTPSFDVAPLQARDIMVTVVSNPGTVDESRATAPLPFRMQNEVLHPSILAVSPNAGYPAGGMRVTIFGSAFQAPVEVFFGDEPARVIAVSFNQIVVISPRSDYGQVAPIRVVNINSATTTELDHAFRYYGRPHGSLPRTSVDSATATRRSIGEFAGRSSTSTSP